MTLEMLLNTVFSVTEKPVRPEQINPSCWLEAITAVE